MFSQKKYQSLLDEIFIKFPSFQIVGDRAFKPGLDNMMKIDKHLGFPSSKFKSIHIAGTNGKGSVSSMLAAALSKLGYKTALYTSPHLADFRERIKVDGTMVPQEYVFDFLSDNKDFFDKIGASFFEITTSMAFSYFADKQVDIAIIECGLGGRLDSTNIILPALSVITNIGYDHCQYLGNTLEEIAREKGGIIKDNIPVVIGEKLDSEVSVFEEIAQNKNSILLNAYLLSDKNIHFEKNCKVSESVIMKIAQRINDEIDINSLDLKGDYQINNIKTASVALAAFLQTIGISNKQSENLEISQKIKLIVDGIENAAKITGLRGRWDKLSDNPLVICDIGHNPHSIPGLIKQINRTHNELQQKYGNQSRLFFVFGIMRDKDLSTELEFLPRDAYYIWVNASSPRSLPASELAQIMKSKGFEGQFDNSSKSSVNDGVKRALSMATNEDFIFIGGSSYVVAEVLSGTLFRK